MDQSHRHDALGQTTSPVISSMRAASAVISVFPSVPRNVLILQKFRPLSTRTAACTAAAAWKPAQNRSSKRGVPMNQSEKRQFLIHELLKEAPEFQGLSVPSDSEGQKQLLRGLMNIRPPRKCSREFLEIQDSYLTAETAAKGITHMKLPFKIQPPEDLSTQIKLLSAALDEADCIIAGAGAGLSTSAGFLYSGERFRKYFSDFEEKYNFHDMYSSGFYPYDTLEEYWVFWSRYIWINRYMNPPKPVYEKLHTILKGKDYFVLTTNVDHCFQKAGFDKHRLFYTQGDYGLFQCSRPCQPVTYDNEKIIRQMVLSQGFKILEDNTLLPPASPKMAIPSNLVPRCPHCGKPLTMNLRADSTFVEDEGWHQAAERYSEFLRRHQPTKVLFLELGTGYNTPGIIKYPFWNMTDRWPDARYACINLNEALAPEEIAKKSICIEGDIGEVLAQL